MADDEGFLIYRTCVVGYALVLPPYFAYRFLRTVSGTFQVVTCVLELYGALNVLLLGFVRFRRPWAPAVPRPPSLEQEEEDDGDDDGDGGDGDGSGVDRCGGGCDRGVVDAAATQRCGTSGTGGSAWARSGRAHGRRARHRGPFDVAILIPCYSEPDEVIFGTVRAALALRDPLASRVRVVLCDDGARPARAARLAQLAPPERALYVARPKDPSVPRHGKAGNLNYTLREVLYPGGGRPSLESAIIVFDCDMEAHGDFLSQTLPYLVCEPRTALVQTPQHFFNVVPSADLFNHHNLTFYQVSRPAPRRSAPHTRVATAHRRTASRWNLIMPPTEFNHAPHG